MNKKSKHILLVIVLLLIIIGTLSYIGIAWADYANDSAGAAAGRNDNWDRIYEVKRGNLILGLMQNGNITAKEKFKISLQANTNTKLLWVVDENTKVKKGDLLAKFETSQIEEKINSLTIECENLEKDLLIELESERILNSSNESEIRSAQDTLQQAEDAMRKYQRFERRKQRDTLDLSIRDAQAKYDNAVANYSKRNQEIAQSGSVDKEEVAKNVEELKTLKNAVNSAANALKNSNMERKVFKRYDHPAKYKALENAVKQAQLRMEKTQVSTQSSLVKQQRSIDNLHTRIKMVQEELKRYQTYLEQMQLFAPADGVVVYGNPDNPWGNVELKLGMDVNKGTVLMTIPDMSNMVVDFDLPEQYRSKISINNRAVITPDALPGLKLNGAINRIATLPVNLIIWDKSSPKIYKSQIILESQSDLLVNGMSVQVNIIAGEIKDTIFVPVEAVFEEDDRYFVYKQTLTGPVEVDVTVGESNNNFVQLLDGVKEDDKIFLYRPFQKKEN